MSVGYTCTSTLKDIEGTIINQGDLVVYREYDRIMKGVVRKIHNNSVVIDPKSYNSVFASWVRTMNGSFTEKFILVLEKHKK